MKNQTGMFGGLAAGIYTLTVTDATGCTPHVMMVEVKQPTQLVATLQTVDASCNTAKDGIIRYIITGGTPPYEESTNNGDNWFLIGTSTSTTQVFDRRAGAGTYEVIVRDANGCETVMQEVTIGQPGALTITAVPW